MRERNKNKRKSQRPDSALKERYLTGPASLAYDELVATIGLNLTEQEDSWGRYPRPQCANLLDKITKHEDLAILATFELARRLYAPRGQVVRSPSDLLKYLYGFASAHQENFFCLSLNGAHELITCRLITMGLANSCQTHVREVFTEAIRERACAVILAHNHPSGSLEPSQADLDVCQRFDQASEIIGIKILDHVIFSTQGLYSIKLKERVNMSH